MMRHPRQLLAIVVFSTFYAAIAQSDSNLSSPDSLKHVRNDATMTFVLRDGSCVNGTVKKASPKTILVQTNKTEPVAVEAKNILQVRQGDAPLLSARSSWADVANIRLYPHEVLIVTFRDGKQVKGKPSSITPALIVIKNGLHETRRQKADVKTVDYVRVKPESDGFDFLSQEAPLMLFFNGEFYTRMLGLEGKVIVRLYDSDKPEDDMDLVCPKR